MDVCFNGGSVARRTTDGTPSWRTAVGVLLLSLLPVVAHAHPGSGIVVDRHGNVYFVDTGSGLWKIDSQGKLIRIPAQRFHWMTLDADDRFANVRLPSVSGGEVERVGSDGNLYYPMRGPPAGLDFTRLLPSGRSALFARIPLHWLNGLAAAPDGSFYYTGNEGVWRVSSSGQVTAVASHVALRDCATIPGTETEAPMLRGLAVDSTETPWSPTAVALHGTDLFVLEYLHTAVEDRLAWVPRVRKVTADGRSVVIATVSR